MSRLFATVLLSALILRLALFSAIAFRNPSGFMQSDSYVYMKLAGSIAKSGVFSSTDSAPYLPDHNRTPAYPAFLAFLKLLGLDAPGSAFIQILLSLVPVFLVMYFCRSVLGLSDAAAALAGGIVALDIPTVVLSNSILTETLFTLFLLAAAYFLFSFTATKRMAPLIFSALMFGFASLSRPSAFALPFFASAALLAASRPSIGINTALRAGAALLLAYMLVLTPWLSRNRAVFGGAFLSTISHDNLLYVQAAGIDSVIRGVPLEESRQNLERAFTEKYKDVIAAGNILEIKQLESREAVRIILAHPLQYWKNFLRSVFNMLFRPIRNDLDIMLGFTERHGTLEIWGAKPEGSLLSRLKASTSGLTMSLIAFQSAHILAAYALALCGLVPLFRAKPAEAAVLLSVIVYFCLTSGAPETYARFRVPIIPFAAVFAASGAETLLKRYHRRIPS